MNIVWTDERLGIDRLSAAKEIYNTHVAQSIPLPLPTFDFLPLPDVLRSWNRPRESENHDSKPPQIRLVTYRLCDLYANPVIHVHSHAVSEQRNEWAS